ncbi:MAG: EF-P beta-lysylation protein EpmB [Planctomycetes bacterium RBG_16_64_10]|nr:MAG: EF-P beta-lysylation protein EpmB [Planctomycetes bacterium RBG_16_64_10]
MALVSSTTTHAGAGSAADRPTSWQQAVQRAVRDPRELCRLLQLPDRLADDAAGLGHDFPLLVPRGYLARMRRGDPDDPLLKQVLPRRAEQHTTPGFDRDPVGDRAAAWRPGLLRKYRGRVLMVTTGACPVHCRYCFRRHFPYGRVPQSAVVWRSARAQIAADRSLHEVILSGGDPLSIADARLQELVQGLAATAHLRRLRVHTRFPIVIPERVTDAMLGWLTGTRLTPVVVLHANHAAELDAAVARAIRRLVEAGVVVLNQAVLLAGVNDQLESLVALCERLVDMRVVPYYLHQLDRVAAAAHFEVPVADGRRLVAALRRRLPGYAVPRYVRELPGQPSKVVLA